ncbi:hypothetical protein FSP39_016041 [Pinctada imbricata]|uniref:B30.2/SPRY domain-containing protein n=1 Tax=Pinctada imbricata TaxID=66713 RepID=A0AA88Y8T5_PINIB|nr:hypothetical protein FSP39_016041 [Pinctada imbricata]
MKSSQCKVRALSSLTRLGIDPSWNPVVTVKVQLFSLKVEMERPNRENSHRDHQKRSPCLHDLTKWEKMITNALPFRSQRTSRCRHENVKMDGQIISYQPGKGDDRVGSYIAEDPLTPQNYYFEVKILDIGTNGTIGVGLVSSNYPMYNQPGWKELSVGFHADDGHLYLSAGYGDEFGPTSTTGDTIGCGIEFPTDADKYEILILQHVEVFFTHNGKKVGSTTISLPKSGLFPAVGLHSRGEKVKLNLEVNVFVPALPPRDKRTSRCRYEIVRVNGEVISYQPGKGDDRVGLYTAGDPLTPHNYYFEVEILDIGTDGLIGVGLVPSNYPRYRQPGWEQSSVGFHADDGHLYLSAGYGDEFGPTSTTGDTIGCGIEFPTDADKDEIVNLQLVEVFFTHNGKKVGSTTTALPRSGFFPAVGLHSRGEKVKLNLEADFLIPVFDVEREKPAFVSQDSNRVRRCSILCSIVSAVEIIVRIFFNFFGFLNSTPGNPTYTPTNLSASEIIDNHKSALASFGFDTTKLDLDLPYLYCIPKMHKNPYKQRFIAGSSKCSTKSVSILLTKVLSEIKSGLQKYCSTVYSRSGINHMWILKNSKELLEHLKSTHFSRVHSIKAFDFSTLYTTIPHSKLKGRLAKIISNAFTSKNGNRKYKFIVVNYDKTYFVKEKSDSENKYTETDIIQMLNFLIDNIFVVFGGKVFQQIVGIPMGTNCAPLLADIFLYSYEAEFIQSLVSEGKRYLASDFNFTYRYIDDVLSINNPKFADYLSSIYPSELEVKETTETNNSASYLDIMLSYDTDGHMNTSLYDKRDDFNFSITNFPFLSSNIPSSPAYGVFISQLIRYARASTKYTDFVLRARRLSDKLLSQGYVCDRLTSSLRKFYGRYGELVIHYDVPLSRMVNDILS